MVPRLSCFGRGTYLRCNAKGLGTCQSVARRSRRFKLKNSWDGSRAVRIGLGLAYFGSFDPRVLGLEFTLPPRDPKLPWGADPPPLGPQPGWYAVSVSLLRGLRFAIPDGQGNWVWLDQHGCFDYFRRFQPLARAGYSIYIYHITPEEAELLRKEMGLTP